MGRILAAPVHDSRRGAPLCASRINSDPFCGPRASSGRRSPPPSRRAVRTRQRTDHATAYAAFTDPLGQSRGPRERLHGDRARFESQRSRGGRRRPQRRGRCRGLALRDEHRDDAFGKREHGSGAGHPAPAQSCRIQQYGARPLGHVAHARDGFPAGRPRLWLRQYGGCAQPLAAPARPLLRRRRDPRQ
ncbi:MAG: hypothetical protein RL385_1611 [Pseudomonadota bacterium]